MALFIHAAVPLHPHVRMKMLHPPFLQVVGEANDAAIFCTTM
jgi:hypothetical protein